MGVMQRYFPADFLANSPSILLFSNQKTLTSWANLALGRQCQLGVEESNDLHALLQRLTNETPALVVMEWNSNGETLACIQQLRKQHSDVGILLLCRQEHCAERVAAYSAGADICLPLPVVAEEFLAVVMTLAQRVKRVAEQAEPSANMLCLDLKRGALCYGQKALCLHRPELDFVQALAEAPRHFLSNDELLARLRYPEDIYGKRRLEVMLSRFRQRLRPLLGDTNPINAGRSKGYGFIVPIRVL